MKYILLIIVCFTSNLVSGQILDPVKVQLKTKKISATEYILSAELKIDTPFKVVSAYSIDTIYNLNFEILYENLNYFDLVGSLQEFPKSKNELDSAFNVIVRFNRKKVVYSQKIKIKTSQAFSVKGDLTYFARTDRMAIAPTQIKFMLTFDRNNLLVKELEQD